MKNSTLLLIIFLFSSMAFVSCYKEPMDYSKSINDLKAQVTALQNRSDSLANALKITNNNVSSLSKTIDSIKTQLTTINNQLVQLNSQLTGINSNIALITSQIATLNQQYANLLAQLNAILNQLAGGAPSTLNTGLLAFYPFNGNANDESGNLNNGITVNVTSITDRNGKLNSAYLFNKIDSYIDLRNKAIIGSSNSARSIFGWAKTSDNTQYVRILSSGTQAPGQSFNILLMWNGVPSFMGYHPYDFLPNNGAKITDGKWHFVGITYDGTLLKTWVDGVVQNSTTIKLNTVGNNNLLGYPNEIGKDGVTTEMRFKGELDDFRFYNRVLTDAEISYLATH